MEHTKHALKRHNGPTGWLVILGLIYVLASGLVQDRALDYESDKVEQSQ